MKKIALFGSTGSIGRNTLDVVAALDGFQVLALSGNRNLELLQQQAKQFRPRWVVVTDENAARGFAWDLPAGCELCVGHSALTQVAQETEIDIVVCAIVGRAGLESTVAAVAAGKRVALANKESLVMGGAIVSRLRKETRAEILPVDSEHSAIFQALHSGRREEVERVILTASGGPFLRWREEDLRNVTLEAALQHPTWNMGAKVTLDSASLMNKALEIIEARWLFDLRAEQLAVMIHPQSVVHSMVEFRDGAVLAQMSPPDMRLPIQYALCYPQRVAGGPTRRMDWTQAFQWEFLPPTSEARYDALRLGLEVARWGGTAGTVLNVANELAVEAFCQGRLRFDEIVPWVRRRVEEHDYHADPTLEELIALDEKYRQDLTNPNHRPLNH
ncbi:MAG: 1-deoxy-D-xylulose-5-phosphate reductoisomerase [Planctomycetia bacterium]|nr:1-deoxy-D-xylulose-5-phosphate reductoisomerase [Planctomycetia bacterium]